MTAGTPSGDAPDKHLFCRSDIEKTNELLREIMYIQANYIADEDPKVIFDLILSSLLRLTESEYGFIGEILTNRDGSPYLKTYALTNIAWNAETRDFYAKHAPEGLEFSNLETLFGAVLKTGAPVIANEPGTDPRRGGLPPGHPPLRCFLGIPFKKAERPIGMVGIANRPGGYEESMLTCLEPFLATCANVASAVHQDLLRRASEAELRKANQRTETLINAMPDIVFFKDTEGRYLVVNRACENFFGISAASIIGRKDEEILLKELSECCRTTEAEAIRTGSVFTSEEVLQREDRTIFLSATKVPVYDEIGAFSGIVGVVRDITTRKQEEEALSRAKTDAENEKAKTDAIIAALADAISIQDTDFRVIYQNPAHRQLVGSHLGEYCFRAYQSKDAVCDSCHLALSFQDGKVHTLQQVRQTADGPRYYEITSSPVSDSGGKIIAGIEAVREITERKRAEDALRESEARLKDAQQLAHVGDWEWDITTNEVHWSDELYRIYGYEPRQIMPDYRLVVEAMHPDVRDTFLLNIESALKGESGFEMDYTFFRTDNSAAILHTVGHVVRSANGTPLRMVGIVQDITAQKLAEQALRDSEEKFRGIFDHANDGILIAESRSKTFIEANRAICRMLGYTRNELLSLGMTDIHPQQELPLIYAEFERQMRGEKIVAESLPVLKKDGTVFYADICAAAIPLGDTHYSIGIFRDMSEHKRAAEQIRAALAEKEILLKEVHHRVKNNLQVIASLLQLQSGCIRDAEARRVFEESQKRIESMSLIHEKLYQSKDLANIDFGEYVYDLVRNLMTIHAGESRRVSVRIGIEDLRLDVNTSIPCGLIINELVSNALRHAFPGERTGMISLAMEQAPPGRITLTVADNGMGFPETADFRNTPSLGMQLVVSLVRQLGGCIDLSRSGGTVFTITFSTTR